jgi:choline dehydrogenase
MATEVVSYDYIVVGAGSAGAVVAARLTENPKVTVLLIEAGPEDNSHWSKVPLGFAKILFDPKYMWYHESEPEPHLNGRKVALPHGKVIGGSSSVNGLAYIRGMPLDYALWRQMGADGWSYDEVLPYFKKTERYRKGANAYHGGDGPIGVESAGWKNPLADAFIEAARSIGLPSNDDFAGATAEGAGYLDLTTWKGRRSSTAEAYIKPNRKRPNLRIVSEALVTRIQFEGRQAIGVEYERGGQTIQAKASGEVILSAGALQSPQLLQLSGVGPGELLADLGIPVVHAQNGVGENLMDHIHTGLSYTTTSRFTINHLMANPISRILAGLNYYVGPRNGFLTIGAGLAGAYFSTRPGLEGPDIQMGFVPFLPDKNEVWKLAEGSGFRLGFSQARPESRGDLKITSPDIRITPAIRMNYLSTENDLQTLLAATKIVRRIGLAEPLRSFGVKEVDPGPGHDSDEALLDYIRETGSTSFHFSGTCRMGKDDRAVVDPFLRVSGIGNLRVIDASVMPTIVSGNTNAAVLMIGEKGADMIKADYRRH